MFTVVAVAIYYVCINPMKALVWAGIVQGVRRSRTCLGVKLTQDGIDRVRFLSENSFRRDPKTPNNIASTCKVIGKVESLRLLLACCPDS